MSEDLFIPFIFHPCYYVLANFTVVKFCYHVIKAIKYSTQQPKISVPKYEN